MDDETSGGNHFAVQAGQVIMLYTFSLYSAVCQWHLSKTEGKKIYKENFN